MESTELFFNTKRLIPAIVQDVKTKQVLMLAWMNVESIALTRDTGKVHFWSRSRNELWLKGATSGNYLHFVEMRVDCDGDTLLLLVHPAGPTCHTGNTSCFYRKITEAGAIEEVINAE